MENLTCEELAILGTMIAVEIAKNKKPEQIRLLKRLVGQILATLNTMHC